MGFKFGNTSFTVGIVEIDLAHIDTEKMTANITFTIPALGGKFKLHLYSGKNWEAVRSLTAEVNFIQNSPEPEPTGDIPWEDGDEEESPEE